MDNILTPLFPEPKLQNLGWRYLLFQVVFLSNLFGLAISLLGIRLPGTVVNLLYFSVNAAVAVIPFRSFWKQTLSAVQNAWLRIVAVSIGGFFAYRVLSALMGMLILTIDNNFANVNDQNIQLLTRDSFLMMALGTVVLAPVAEEVFNRGCVFGGLYRRNPVAAYAVSSVVFSIIHVSGYMGLVSPLTLFLCFLQYLPAGLCLAAAYQLSGSILAPILIHSAVNAIAILSMR